jgi:hypothetical protein
MSEHTPGPWVTDDIQEGDKYRYVLASENEEVIARIMLLSPWGLIITAEANARLIAAAPDLLEALKAFANEIVPNNPNDPLWVNARAAIAKATGEQP